MSDRASRIARGKGWRARRGALLLEVMLSLTLFVAAGGAVLAIVSQGVGSLNATRRKLHAADLARSAMAEIEAGLATPETLNGPVPVWTDPEEELGGASGELRESGWELRIETSVSPLPGLTLVTITAARSGVEEGGSSYTLTQLVRLSSRVEDTIGEEDEITEAGERGERRGAGRQARPEPRGEEGRR